MDSSLLCALLLILAFIHASSFSQLAKGFTLDIVHRSKLSPSYQKKSTAGTTSLESTKYKLGSPTIAKSSEYLIKLYVGYPPVEVYAAADTGSDFFWVQTSSSCPDCYRSNIHLFDPTQSYTFSPLLCYEPECYDKYHKDWHQCGSQNECNYIYQYADASYSRGLVSRETVSISLSSSSPENGQSQTMLVEYPNILIGCSLEVKGYDFENFHVGLVGLNRGPMSLISQLGIQKFSYCFQPPDSDSYGKFSFGDEDGNTDGSLTRTDVVSTPLIQNRSPYDYFYYLNLEGATVVGSKTTIQNNHNGNSTFGSNILIDSGTTLTYLEDGFYKSLLAEVKSAISLKPVQPPKGTSYDLCYDEIPEIEVVFHFTGADVTLKPVNLFEKMGVKSGGDDYVCFAMMSSGEGFSDNNPMNIWGNIAQINFQVTTDLVNSLMSFAPADCGHV